MRLCGARFLISSSVFLILNGDSYTIKASFLERSSSSLFFLLPDLGLRKPSKVKVFPASPLTLISVTDALAPGMGTTGKPASLTALTSLLPGSLTPGVPASEQ